LKGRQGRIAGVSGVVEALHAEELDVFELGEGFDDAIFEAGDGNLEGVFTDNLRAGLAVS
jgi:hypothetical protein